MAPPTLITEPAAAAAWQKATRGAQRKYDNAEHVSSIAKAIGDYRLDWFDAIVFAIELSASYDSTVHHNEGVPMTFREIARLEFPERFCTIQNVGVAAQAWDILRSGDRL